MMQAKYRRWGKKASFKRIFFFQNDFSQMCRRVEMKTLRQGHTENDRCWTSTWKNQCEKFAIEDDLFICNNFLLLHFRVMRENTHRMFAVIDHFYYCSLWLRSRNWSIGFSENGLVDIRQYVAQPKKKKTFWCCKQCIRQFLLAVDLHRLKHLRWFYFSSSKRVEIVEISLIFFLMQS